VGVGRRTIVAQVRRAGGALERWRTLRGSLGVAGVAYDGSNTGLSADGRTLVLAETIRRYPPRRTRLVVLDARRLRTRGHIVLPGYFGVDAISPDGRWLYLIHYTSARDVTRYDVRAYDMRARRLLAQRVVDPSEPEEAMRGVPLTRAMSADGRWAYTLYDGAGKAPFIHALDTARRTAVCVDLPPALGRDDLSLLRLALGPGGATLRLMQAGTPVAVVDTRTFAVGRPGTPAPRAPAARAAGGGGTDVPWALGAAGVAALAALGAGAGVARRRRHVRSARV
jgi:hypothetical protein